MFKLSLAQFSLCCLALSGGLACSEPVTVAVGAETGSSTGGASTAPDVPTMGGSADSPTTTATTTTITTTTGSAGEEPGTSGSSSEALTAGAAGCGDGIVDPGEECDDTIAGNGDTRYCTTDCTLNVCGDGKLFVGWELCDEGSGNSDAYGSICDAHCTPGARCGDSKLQPEFETCDLGVNNGGMKGDEQGILCDASCRAQQLRG